MELNLGGLQLDVVTRFNSSEGDLPSQWLCHKHLLWGRAEMFIIKSCWAVKSPSHKSEWFHSNKQNIASQLKREIMPHCILKIVRNWFSKNGSDEYIGHYWGEN